MLALSLIARNNEDTLPRLLNSVAKYVDAIYVTDTGSTDRTVAIAEEYGAVVSHFDWCDDFAAARNYAFSQIPPEYKYILWLDTDDVVEGGQHLKSIVEQMEAQQLTATYFTYNYTIDPETGQVLVTHTRERVIERDKYEWKGRLHETLIPRGKQNAVFSPLVVVNHLPADLAFERNEARNMRILLAQYEDEGENKDPRTEYYLARAYFDSGEYAKANSLFQDYLEHSGWDEERAMAWNYLGEIHKLAEDYDTAIECYLKAAQERPDYPTWYVNLAMVYALQKKWEQALHWVKLSMHVPQKDKTAMVLNPRDDMARALETIFFASFHTGKLDEAWAAATKLVQLFPGNEAFKSRLEGITSLRKWEKLTQAAAAIAEELNNDKESYKLEGFLNSLPAPIVGNSLMARLRHEVLPPQQWARKTVVYFCGRGFEKWDPSSLERGVGGSETAVIELAREWVKQGYEVTVFGWPEKEGIYDGVNYQYYWRCNFDDTFDVFISWRNESIFSLPIKARLKLLDCHDVLNQADILPVDSQIDYYLVKSNYHRTFLPDIPDEKFKVISNGISLFDSQGERTPYQLLYASSYDRGLEHLLTMWPKIKEAVPEATLQIAYGWNLFDEVMRGNPERMLWKKKMVELMSQDGVSEVGRVSKEELHRLHQQSALLAYYCTFEEINCITVLEAQANGCLPITTDYAALKETNEYGVKVPGSIYAKDTKTEYANAIINALKNPISDKKRQQMAQAIASKYAWSKIAKEWIGVFNER